ncbi:MAG: TonB-dependent receptor domain-containing protein, partial [Candidatus Acidiferrales bacterium]
PLGLAGGNNLPNTNTDSPIRAQLLSLSYISIWGPSVVNEARFGWNLYQQDFFAQDRRVFGNPNTSIGLNNGVSDPRDFGLPTTRVGGFAALGSAPFSNPRGRDDTNWHFIDGVSVKRNRHEWKFGYEFRRTAVDSFYDAQFRGVIDFDDLSQFLAGNIAGGRIVRGNTFRETRQNSHAVYAQDSWRMANNFTLNLGLRYDFYGVITEEGNRFSVYDPTAGLVIRPEVYEPDYNNFSPRVSFAWDLGGNGRTVLRAGFGMFYDLFAQDFFVGQIPFNCFSCPGVGHNPTGPDPVLLSLSPVGTLAPNVPVFPTAGDSFDAFTIDELKTPYIYNFNLNIQQQLGSKAVFQIGYVGSAGHKLFRIRDINHFDTATITANDIACAGGAGIPIGVACVYPGKPFDTFANLDSVNAPFPPFYLNQLETSTNSNYHSLQASLMQRNLGGWTQQIHYRWSHSIDDASDGQDFVPNASMPQDSTNPSGNRGNSNFDVRHSLIWTSTYEFPRWQAAGWFGEGWQISGVLSLISGHPFHLNYNFTDDYSGSQTFLDRPDVTAAPQYNYGDPQQFLDLSVFTVPCTLDPAGGGNVFADACLSGTRHFGSLGRNSLLGPDFKNFDFSLVKVTPFGERIKLHLRADIFNIFNRPNFSNPWLPTFFAAADPNGIHDGLSGPLGQSAGILPITATVDVGLGNPILGGGGPRSVQFAAKLTW